MQTPGALRTEVLTLYKLCLRTAKRVPVERPRAKAVANVQELFRFYKEESDPNKVKELLEMGKHDLQTLRILATLKPEFSEKVYKADGFNK